MLTAVVVLAALASAAIVLLGTEPPPDVVAEEVVVPRSGSSTTAAPTTTEAAPRAGEPGRVVIDRIGVDAEVIDLGLDDEGALEVPTDFSQTGWWTGGARPGEDGPAVIVGHVDSVDGPAVFFRLEELEPGDEVTVVADDGTPTTFVVERSRQVAKDEFPTEEVYGATDDAELRLVTCDGDFDRSTGHYDDNLIVFLREVGPDA
ncbi:class F sortase [Iamia majanohamensis]|uniref:Class F sortase n=1 Tax=Iamia majanohamensis TaxID=467976 RepID=A0AAE9Y746_9ACTN|nr:class F sortase [Iamia majanohamensis]WCO66871.1 class F sortase [Iamia majanohamensis]